ncbi:MAG: hypothetical protein WDA16_04630 [Candidatus Thermoplasmatota archaeon]
MMTWRTGLMLLAALSAVAVPAVSTDPGPCTSIGELGVICEHNAGGEECETPDRHVTEVFILGSFLYTRGERGCNTYPSGSYSYSGITVYGPAFTMTWSESGGQGGYQCYMYFWAGKGVQQPCVVPPPNPGWGHLLP